MRAEGEEGGAEGEEGGGDSRYQRKPATVMLTKGAIIPLYSRASFLAAVGPPSVLFWQEAVVV